MTVEGAKMHLSVVALRPLAGARELRWTRGEPSVLVLNNAARLCSRWLFSFSPSRMTSMLFCALSRQRAPAAKELRPGEDDRFVENAKRPPVVLEVAVNRRRGTVVVIAAADGDAVLPGDVRLFLASVSLIDDDVVVVAAAAISGPAGGAMPTIIAPLLDKTGAIVLVQGESEAAEVALVEEAEVVFMVETTAAVRCAAGGKQVADGGVA